MGQKIVFFEDDSGVDLRVRLEKDTVWLSQQQIAQLFGSSRTNIVEHIDHVYTEGELSEEGTCRNFRQVQKEGSRDVTRELPHYNLDMIISVGYRVKSRTATRFRIWATNVLRQHIVQGYTANQKRLNQINTTLQILSRSADETIQGIATVINRYASGLSLLDKYDHHTLNKPKGAVPDWELTYDEARAFVDSMSFSESSSLFGVERDDSFKGVVAGIYQSFGGVELYASVQEKAANLLYLIVKDHSFTDGNKRIAAALFVYFLEKNDALRGSSSELLISNNALAAITLMIALSHPEEKEAMCLLVMNMLDTRESI
jgi:prophage maintenance system killer protein